MLRLIYNALKAEIIWYSLFKDNYFGSFGSQLSCSGETAHAAPDNNSVVLNVCRGLIRLQNCGFACLTCDAVDELGVGS